MIQKPTTLHIYLNKIVLHQLNCGSLNQFVCHVELFSVMTCCSIKTDHGPSGQLRLLLAEFAPAHHTTASHTHACCSRLRSCPLAMYSLLRHISSSQSLKCCYAASASQRERQSSSSSPSNCKQGSPQQHTTICHARDIMTRLPILLFAQRSHTKKWAYLRSTMFQLIGYIPSLSPPLFSYES